MELKLGKWIWPVIMGTDNTALLDRVLTLPYYEDFAVQTIICSAIMHYWAAQLIMFLATTRSAKCITEPLRAAIYEH